MGSLITLTELRAAQTQLERAIVLFPDDDDFVSAITLAGAAEELLGKLLAATQREPIVGNYATAVSRFNVILDGEPVEKKHAIAQMNSARNFLKLGGDGTSASFDLEEEARELIDRAVSNFWLLTQQETPTTTRFRPSLSPP